jgi:ubiquinone/menaquinone biosynthesis C-methylase UbiE
VGVHEDGRGRGEYVARLDHALRPFRLDHDFFARAKAQAVLEVARRRLGDPASLAAVDVGCGVGLVDRHLTDSFGSLTGVDVSSDALAEAVARNPGVHYVHSLDGRIPLDAESFDVAIAATVIQVVDPRERPSFAAELARVVRPGGLVVVVEHNPLNPLTRVVVRRCDHQRIHMLGLRSLERLLLGASLTIAESRYLVPTPWEGDVAAVLEGLISKLRLGAQYCVVGRKEDR